MNQKYIILIVLLLSVGLYGCSTVKGAGTGFGEDLKSLGKGFNSGTENTGNGLTKAWHALKRTDNWLKENYW